MNFVIGLLTVLLVLDCVGLILLVLVQLPKKEAGAGLAFGGSAADALFGAGSGNVLTKATKYAAIIFFGLTIVLSLLNTRMHRQRSTLQLPENWQPQSQPAASPVSPAPAVTPTMPAAVTNPLTAPAPGAVNPPAAAVPVVPPVAPGTPSPAPATPNP